MTTLFRHAAQVVGVAAPDEHRKSGAAMRAPGLVQDGAVVVDDGRIAWVGPVRVLPPIPPHAEIVDCTDMVVLPAFVDSHTHLLFAGSREDEFEQRLQGRTYQQIAAAGGGILSTVRRVREASREELKDLARPRLRRLLAFGVATVEVKSGYGLTLADELKCLEAIADLNTEGPLELVPDVPRRPCRAAGVPRRPSRLRPPALRRDAAGGGRGGRLADFCDVFCETGVFGLDESRTHPDAGARPGLAASSCTPTN